MRRIQYVEGVPNWFTRLLHLMRHRRCRKVGHRGVRPGDPVFTCVHCGQILREFP